MPCSVKVYSINFRLKGRIEIKMTSALDILETAYNATKYGDYRISRVLVNAMIGITLPSVTVKMREKGHGSTVDMLVDCGLLPLKPHRGFAEKLDSWIQSRITNQLEKKSLIEKSKEVFSDSSRHIEDFLDTLPADELDAWIQARELHQIEENSNVSRPD
jgi:hypothetical protein